MRIDLIAETHLSARSPERVANWHAARRAVGRLSPELTVNLGDIRCTDTQDGVRHVWMPSSGFILPDHMQPRVGVKLVGIGMLDFKDAGADFDLWCPNGMVRHEVSNLRAFQQVAAGGGLAGAV
jgi:hypothetical protein